MKIIYVGLQRCGTQSFRDFFLCNGFKVWGWDDTSKSKISELVDHCDFNEIIRVIKDYDVLQDFPFYYPELAAFIAQEIPDSKFVYLERPAESWFDSMLKLQSGLTLGDVEKHCYFYNRLGELNHLRMYDPKIRKIPMIGSKEHYIKQYYLHKEKISYLLGRLPSNRFYSGSLYDKDKYQKMSDQFGLNLDYPESVRPAPGSTSNPLTCMAI